MGASLPAASRWLKTTPEGVSWMGMLYGANTVGAVFGCLLAGFYLLRVFDMATATFVAAAINIAVGLVSFSLAKRAPAYRSASLEHPPANRQGRARRLRRDRALRRDARSARRSSGPACSA